MREQGGGSLLQAGAVAVRFLGLKPILIVLGIIVLIPIFFFPIFIFHQQQEIQSNQGGILVGDIKFVKEINEAANRYGINPAIIAAIVKQESNFDPKAGSEKGAQGLMQLMPETAAELGVKDPLDPEQNIMGGTKYLASLLERYDGNLRLALAAYNSGPGKVDANLRAGGDGIPAIAETKNYVPSVLKHMEDYQKKVHDGEIVIDHGSDRYPYKNGQPNQVDKWLFFSKQCTSYVAWKLNAVGIPFHNLMGGGRFGDAGNWANNARMLGYKVNHTPAVGAVAQWEPGAFGHSRWGHVAYVTKVEGGMIEIEEYNYKPYQFSKRRIPANQVSNYIHFK
ncbi:transglycosylase SLT domain-containing protein [Kroppenstedtia eburnea]|uniref:transglycosylase SLT domain-containing protein n=1 Tax=Kroppenstedtia eburnea TaxID=714067 RepID=UPI00362815A9